MASYAEYFAKHRPRPKFLIGARVFGFWNKIPFIGTVLNDNMVSESEGPKVIIYSDLPIRCKDEIRNLISVKQKHIKLLKKF